MDSDPVPIHRLTRRRGTGWIVALLLLGAVLRVAMLGQDVRFHPDEALYASFARRVSLNGDFLLSDAPLDKPPLAIASVALSFSLLGPTEFAARLPSFFASLLTLASLYALARRLYGTRTALLTTFMLALSPFDLAFAATVFLDPLLTLWLVLACLAASRDRWLLAGVAFALAVATKQTAVLFVPLIILLGLCVNAEKGWRLRNYLTRLLNFTIPILIAGIMLILWSTARAAPIDFWTLGAINNTPDRLIRANEIIPRLGRWLAYLANVTGFAPLLFLAFIPPVLRTHIRQTLVSIALATFTLGVLLAYWLIAFNTYDRYVHPLVPLILMLVAHGTLHLTIKSDNRYSEPLSTGSPSPRTERGSPLGSDIGWANRAARDPKGRGEVNAATPLTPSPSATEPLTLSRLNMFLPIVAVLCILPFTAQALRGQLEIGGDRGQHSGIERLAAAINSLPAGTIVYDYSLEWELDFYLGDHSSVRMVFQPTPQALARAVCAATKPSYFATPASDSGAWLQPIRVRGSAVILADGPFQLYHLGCAF